MLTCKLLKLQTSWGGASEWEENSFPPADYLTLHQRSEAAVHHGEAQRGVEFQKHFHVWDFLLFKLGTGNPLFLT